jgi:hypothetical protein
VWWRRDGYGKLAEPFSSRGGIVSVDKALARDRDLRVHATPTPWHQDGHGTRFRLLGPLPRATVVVDPYAPNPQDAPLLLHRVNTYEVLEEEIERLRTALREIRTELEATRRRAGELRAEDVVWSLANDLRERIGSVLGDGRGGAHLQPTSSEGRNPGAARIPDART